MDLMTDIATSPGRDWQQTLNATIHVGDGVQKRFGDCTRADLRAAAEASRKLVESEQDHIALLERMASALAE